MAASVVLFLAAIFVAGCEDTTPPVITFFVPPGYEGEPGAIIVPCGAVFDPFNGVEASDPGNNDPVKLEIESQLFNNENGADHILTIGYLATDKAGHQARAARTAKFEDDEAPRVEFDPDYVSRIGGRWVTIVTSESQINSLDCFEAVDTCEGNITDKATKTVAPGENSMIWNMTIRAKDQAGNEAVEILTILNFGPAGGEGEGEGEGGEGEGEGEGEPGEGEGEGEGENETPLADFYLDSGASLPWINYGRDFGTAEGFASAASREQLRNSMMFLAQNGVSVVTVFLGCDLLNGIRDYNGAITWDPIVFTNNSALLTEAQSVGLRVNLVLLDYTVADGVAITDDGTIVGERPELLYRQKADFLGLWGQFLATYQGNPAIYGLRIINHPERAIALSNAEMKAFIRDAATEAHVYGFKASVCSRSRLDVGQWQGLNLDFYEFSYDDSMESSIPLDYPAGLIGLDKPIMVDVQASAVWLKMNMLRQNGYAGALFWSLNGDPAEGDFGAVAERYLAYFLNN